MTSDTPTTANPSYYPRPLPPGLEGLAELALDVRWNWNHGADFLWQAVDPLLWEATGNAWLILQSVSQRRLEELAGEHAFVARLADALAYKAAHREQSRWFDSAHGAQAPGTVAYFSMEFGLGEALPIYSGGLGILAGDHLKAASDLRVPLVGVGILYQQGYFRQALDASGNQLAFYPVNDPSLLPVLPLRGGDGEWLRVAVELPGRTLYLRCWVVDVGETRLFLLDSNHALNTPRDRGITAELYGGNPETRLQQEVVLGVGGWRLIEALGLDCTVCHLNEGHAALVVLERARGFMEHHRVAFAVALRATAAGNVFTSHTPVEAGFDRFPRDLAVQYLAPCAQRLGVPVEQLLALGRNGGGPDAPFNMAWLALRGSTRVNGVSRLHGEVSRRIFAPLFPGRPYHEVPIGHITNGVHTPSWDSAAADGLWTATCGRERWRGDLADLERQFRAVDDEALWRLRCRQRHALVQSLAWRLTRQQSSRGAGRDQTEGLTARLDPNLLTIGFARRFAGYKRPELLLHDPARLERLLADPRRPVQLVVAGKAHPHDAAGRELVRRWVDFMRRPAVHGRMVFVEDYDIGLATELVQGIDLWLNTPRRPWEASGTSGMKVLVNGGLNLSVLDGWWAEAWQPALGWALGEGQEDHPEEDADDALALYRLLEQEVVPEFYDRDGRGIPRRWVARVRESMARLTPRFSTNRMLRQYTEECYLPAAAAYRRRAADGARLAVEIEHWREELARQWSHIHFGQVTVEAVGAQLRFTVPIYLDTLDPTAIAVEIYAQPRREGERCVWPATRSGTLAGVANGFVCVAQVPGERPARDYTPRVVPRHAEAAGVIEGAGVLWAW